MADNIKRTSSEIKGLIGQLNSLKRSIEDLSDAGIGGRLGLDGSEVKALDIMINKIKSYKVGVGDAINEVIRLNEAINAGLNTGNIENLTNAFRSLPNVLDNVSNGLNSSINQLRQYEIAQQKVNQLYQQAKEMGEVYKSSGDTSSKEQVDFYTNIAKQIEELEGKSSRYMEVMKMARDVTVNASNDIEESNVSAFKKVGDVIDTIVSGINRGVNKVINGVLLMVKTTKQIGSTINNVYKTVKSSIERILKLFSNFGNRVSRLLTFNLTGLIGLNNNMNALSGTATELRSKILLLTGAFKRLLDNNLIKKAETLYQSVFSLKNIVGKDATQATIDWANQMEMAFGISARRLLSDLNELSGVLYGLGMNARDVAEGSKNILMVSRYLAFMGAAGGDVKAVTDKLMSGLTGVNRSVMGLGLSVREAKMDEFLASMKAKGGEFANMETSFRNLNEEAKVYVRYAAMMQQVMSKYDLSEFADVMDTTTGRVNILKESLFNLGTTIGQVFYNVLAGVSGYLVVIINLIETAFKKLAGFLGGLFGLDLNTDMWHGMNKETKEIGGAVNDIGSGVGKMNDGLKKADKNAKKLKGTLLGFDRISSINTESSKSKGDGVGGPGFDYSKLMTSVLDELNKRAKDIIDKKMSTLEDTVRKRVDEFLDKLPGKINELGKKVTGRVDFDIGLDAKKAYRDIRKTINNVIGTLKNTGILVIDLGFRVADDMNIGKIFNEVIELTEAFTRFTMVLSDKLRPILTELYDKYFADMVQLFGVRISGALEKATDKFNEWSNALETDEGVNKLKDSLEAIILIIRGGDLDGEQIGLVNAFREAHPVIAQLADVLNILKDIMSTLYTDVLKPIFKEIGKFAQDTALPWLVDKLGELRDFLSSNGENIVKLFKEIGSIAWDSFRIFVEVLGKLIELVVKHPKATANFFKAIIGLKVGSWFLGTANNIGFTVLKLQLLRQVLKGGGIAGLLGGKGGYAEIDKIGSSLGRVGKTLGELATSKAGATLGLALGGSMMAADAHRAKERGGSSIVGAIAGDAEGSLQNVIKNASKWTAVGSSIGTFIAPGIGTGVGAGIGALVGSITGALGETKITEEVDKFVTNMRFGIELVKEEVTNKFENIRTTTTDVIQGVSGYFSEKTNAMVEGASKMRDNISEKMGSLGSSVKESFYDAKEYSVGTWNDAISKFSGIKDNIGNAFGQLKNNISSKFLEAKTASLAAWSDAKTLFGGVANNVFSAFSGLKRRFSELWKGIKENASGTLGKIGDGVKGAVGRNRSVATEGVRSTAAVRNVPGVTFKAKGGSVKGGDLFIANEQGAELIGKFRNGSGVDVANQKMIVDAIQRAVESGMFDAMIRALGTMGDLGGRGDITVNFNPGGQTIASRQQMAEFAREISRYILGNNINIADINFGR